MWFLSSKREERVDKLEVLEAYDFLSSNKGLPIFQWILTSIQNWASMFPEYPTTGNEMSFETSSA